MKLLETFLGFVTLWVVIIAGVVYLKWRLTTPRPQVSAEVAAKCCMEVPCGSKCAEWHQKARDRMDVQYDRIIHEIGEVVTAGRRELEADDSPATSRS